MNGFKNRITMKRVKTILLRFYYDFITINYETAGFLYFVRLWAGNGSLAGCGSGCPTMRTGEPARTARDDTGGVVGKRRRAAAGRQLAGGGRVRL